MQQLFNSQPQHPLTSVQQQAIESSGDYADFEDEPDEVLTEFLKPESTPQPQQPVQSIPAATDYTFEDFEDEPDEILTEFLEPTSQPQQTTVQQTIAPSSNKSAAPSTDGWLTLKEVAESFKIAGVQADGTNYSTLSTKRGEMTGDKFLDYLAERSAKAGRPQRWEFDRSLGQKGKFRPIA